MDSGQGAILKFGATEYGTLINEAVGLRYDGDEAQAIERWNAVLKLDENNELANTGMGKAYLTNGDNKTAMKFLELGMNRTYYSIAYRRYRNEFLADNLGIILTGALILIVAGFVYKKVRTRKGGLE